MVSRQDFNIRHDEHSIQITYPKSKKLFIRITSRPSDKTNIIFSDFILDNGEDHLAFDALNALESSYMGFRPGMRIQFLDIYPSFPSTNDKAELISRHDRIVNIVNNFIKKTGIKIEESRLDQRFGKFDTIIVLS